MDLVRHVLRYSHLDKPDLPAGLLRVLHTITPHAKAAGDATIRKLMHDIDTVNIILLDEWFAGKPEWVYFVREANAVRSQALVFTRAAVREAIDRRTGRTPPLPAPGGRAAAGDDNDGDDDERHSYSNTMHAAMLQSIVGDPASTWPAAAFVCETRKVLGAWLEHGAVQASPTMMVLLHPRSASADQKDAPAGPGAGAGAGAAPVISSSALAICRRLGLDSMSINGAIGPDVRLSFGAVVVIAVDDLNMCHTVPDPCTIKQRVLFLTESSRAAIDAAGRFDPRVVVLSVDDEAFGVLSSVFHLLQVLSVRSDEFRECLVELFPFLGVPADRTSTAWTIAAAATKARVGVSVMECMRSASGCE